MAIDAGLHRQLPAFACKGALIGGIGGERYEYRHRRPAGHRCHPDRGSDG